MTPTFVLSLLLVPMLATSQVQEAAGGSSGGTPAEGDADAWMTDWAVDDGMRVTVDSRGYDLPTAIAFVPHPGSAPDDPLYFVTELRGTVKVVSNDRTVRVFATNVGNIAPKEELPSEQGETGLAGICLAPAQGYVFVTFAYRDPEGILRNDIVRFETRPRTFALQPTGQRSFTEVFRQWRSALSHQIGGCQVSDGRLFVGVGDGLQQYESRNPQALLGKVLRMGLDGEIPRDNPFFSTDSPDSPSGYVWAMGFRNPFGLIVANERVFVAENGPSIDRFLEVQPGGDYLWDGSDWSIGTNAAAVLSPSPAPVQMAYMDPSADYLPPRYRGRLYVAMSGHPQDVGPPTRPGAKGVVMLDYSMDEGRLRSVPRSVLRYRGSGRQLVTGLASGPDGMYVVPLLPDASGQSAILRLSWDPEQAHPYLVTDVRDAEALLGQSYCYGCHTLNGRTVGTVGPVLDQAVLVPRLEERLFSPAYLARLDSLDRSPDETVRRYREARQQVRDARGAERIRVWLEQRIQHPRFDTPDSQMPDLGLSAGEAAILARYLLASPASETLEGGLLERTVAALRRALPRPRYEFVLAAFLAGVVVAWALSRLWRRRRHP